MQDESLWDKIMKAPSIATTDGKTTSFKELYEDYNRQLKGSLKPLKLQKVIKGRDTEVKQIYEIMERPETPVALLLGEAGVGKTALVQEFSRQLNEGQVANKLNYKYVLLALRIGPLRGLGENMLTEKLSTILDTIGSLEKIAQVQLNDTNIKFVLFIDEVHMLVTIFGPGTKIGGDIIKDSLARSPIRVIAATTAKEYDSTIAVDEPLAQRFNPIEMQELSYDLVKEICQNWWSQEFPNEMMIPDEVLHLVLDANKAYRSHAAEPRKSINLLSDLASYKRRTGLMPDRQVVNYLFDSRYSIKLDFKVEADEVYQSIANRVYGQPFALYTLKRALRSMTYKLDIKSNKAMLTLMFTGPTGVGKSETAKSIADGLYPDQNALFNMNMPDYKTPEYEPMFRKNLGERIRHKPNSVILFDEIEKAHVDIQDSLLAILDEGVVKFEVINREGAVEKHSVSLRNTIIIATTNAGHEVFENDAKFSASSHNNVNDLDELERQPAKIDQLMNDLRKFLVETTFKPEFLGRFNRVIPYRRLSSETLLHITDLMLENILHEFNENYGLNIVTNPRKQWPSPYPYVATDVSLYLSLIKTRASDPNAGGARNIKREIESNVTDTIIDALYNYPGVTDFRLYVTQDAKIYNYSASVSEGGVAIEPA